MSPRLGLGADPDHVIRRIERGALVWCGLAAAAALALWPGSPGVAGGVLGGGLLTFVSLYAIRGSIDAVLRLATPATTPAQPAEGAPAADAPARAGVGIVVKLAGRYGLLALAAYVMIVRLRLHAGGVLIGASSLVAAATFEALRGLRR